jgi:hypothetical protein
MISNVARFPVRARSLRRAPEALAPPLTRIRMTAAEDTEKWSKVIRTAHIKAEYALCSRSDIP